MPAAVAAEPSAPNPPASSLPDRPFAQAGAGAGAESREDAEEEDDEEPGPEGSPTDEESEAAPLRALACLEGEGGNESDGPRRGVQKRDFLKRWRVEIAALGGWYAADALSSTYSYGAAVSAFLGQDFGIEAMVTRNRMAFRLEEPFISFTGERHFEAGVAWNALAAMLWSPIHAKLRWSEKSITHADLFFVAGGGRTFNDTVQGLTFQAGIGIKVYLGRFVSIRFDVRDLIMPQEVLGRGRTTHNIAVMAGLGVWVPG
jgi:outer membrane beta-barrel protein